MNFEYGECMAENRKRYFIFFLSTTELVDKAELDGAARRRFGHSFLPAVEGFFSPTRDTFLVSSQFFLGPENLQSILDYIEIFTVH